MFNPGNGILSEFVGEIRVGGLVVFDVELIVEFFKVCCDFEGFTSFAASWKDGDEV